MAISLLRRQSDTPTVQGSDDSRILRYAVGGYNGVTKGYANECGYEVFGSQFKIKSGEIIVDGWQAIIDSTGVTIQTNSSSTKLFYTIYIEYDLRDAENQKVEIKSSYDTESYPTIQSGDDLTQSPSGLKRMTLYNFTAQNNTILSVAKLVPDCLLGRTKNAENVSTYINNVPISSIFSSDGKTVKNANNSINTDFTNTEWSKEVIFAVLTSGTYQILFEDGKTTFIYKRESNDDADLNNTIDVYTALGLGELRILTYRPMLYDDNRLIVSKTIYAISKDGGWSTIEDTQVKFKYRKIR